MKVVLFSLLASLTSAQDFEGSHNEIKESIESKFKDLGCTVTDFGHLENRRIKYTLEGCRGLDPIKVVDLEEKSINPEIIKQVEKGSKELTHITCEDTCTLRLKPEAFLLDDVEYVEVEIKETTLTVSWKMLENGNARIEFNLNRSGTTYFTGLMNAYWNAVVGRGIKNISAKCVQVDDDKNATNKFQCIESFHLPNGDMVAKEYNAIEQGGKFYVIDLAVARGWAASQRQ